MSGFVSVRGPVGLSWVRGRAGHARASAAQATLPELVPGERVLVRADTAGGGQCAATNRALHCRAAPAGPAVAWSRIGWEDIAAVGWSRPDGLMRLSLWPAGQAETQIVLQLPARSRLADFAAEQVLTSRLATRTVRLTAGCDATICAVRVPGEDGMTWKVRVDSGADPTDPAIRRAVDAALRSLRAQFGC